MRKLLLIVLLCVFSVGCTDTVSRDAVKNTVRLQVNWAEFMERHDIIWETLPERFDHGSFHGNGLLGAVIYKDANNRLRWEIGRSDVTDHRRDNNRLPIGGLGLETVGDIQSGTIRLDLWNAESRGELYTTEGTVKFRSFIHAEELALVIEIECTGKEKDSKFIWLPSNPIDGINAKKFPDDPPNPAYRNEKQNDIKICIQPRFAGGQYATAWQEVKSGQDSRRIYLSVADTFPDSGAAKEAADAVEQTAKADFNNLIESHRQWWHGFYPKSFVSIPNTHAESFYWAQMYKLGSATRQDRMVMDLLGPWFRNTGWPRIWWNLNIEIAYSPVYTSNHLELGESLTRMIDRNRDNFARNARDIYGLEDAATVPHTTCYDGLRGDGSRAPDKYINPADFTWALHNYWLQYRYSMDKSMLTDHKKHAFFPLLRGSVNVYLHLLKQGDDGRLHLPIMMSPEYARVADNNYNLSMLRWACQTLLDVCKDHNIEDPLIPRWQEVLDKLVDYPVDETGFMIGANMPLEKSHRHWQHLQMVFPLYQLDFDDAVQRELIEKSILHWQNIEDGKQIYGWSDAAASCLYSVLEDGDNAAKHLLRHHENKRFVMPNTMYIEGSPVIECALFAAKSLQDMLLQSWGDKIRVFPAVPDAWKDVVFHDLRTEGAFLVSASRKNGRTQWVRIKSLAGQPCRINTSMQGQITFLKNDKPIMLNPSDDGVIEIELAKDEDVLLYTGDKVPDAIVIPVPADPKNYNTWGCKFPSSAL